MEQLRMDTGHGQIHADFTVVASQNPNESFSLILNSKNGQGHNPDYFEALDEILSSLRSAGATIVRIDVVSTEAMKAEAHERTIPIQFPIDLVAVTNIQTLRREICAAQTGVVSKASKGGNRHRKIRIDVAAPPDVTRDRFVAGIVPSTGEFRAAVHTSAMSLLEEELSERDKQLDKHEQEILNRAVDGPVERYQLVKSRRGQGVFRHNVLLREKTCRLFGVSHSYVLRASHIKPWSLSNDEEKIDGDNGLMLSPHADVLFDLGYISFEKDGTLLVSELLAPVILESWGITPGVNVGGFSDAQEKYLSYHRSEIFKS